MHVHHANSELALLSLSLSKRAKYAPCSVHTRRLSKAQVASLELVGRQSQVFAAAGSKRAILVAMDLQFSMLITTCLLDNFFLVCVGGWSFGLSPIFCGVGIVLRLRGMFVYFWVVIILAVGMLTPHKFLSLKIFELEFSRIWLSKRALFCVANHHTGIFYFPCAFR